MEILLKLKSCCESSGSSKSKIKIFNCTKLQITYGLTVSPRPKSMEVSPRFKSTESSKGKIVNWIPTDVYNGLAYSLQWFSILNTYINRCDVYNDLLHLFNTSILTDVSPRPRSSGSSKGKSKSF